MDEIAEHQRSVVSSEPASRNQGCPKTGKYVYAQLQQTCAEESRSRPIHRWSSQPPGCKRLAVDRERAAVLWRPATSSAARLPRRRTRFGVQHAPPDRVSAHDRNIGAKTNNSLPVNSVCFIENPAPPHATNRVGSIRNLQTYARTCFSTYVP